MHTTTAGAPAVLVILLLLAVAGGLAAAGAGQDKPAPGSARPVALATALPIVELRQYTLRPGQRDVLIDLFEREFIEGQEATGMTIVGQFRDLDRPDRFVWIRAFPDMSTRARSLTAFYGGPIWQADRAVANATMIDSANVLMLRPAHDKSGFRLNSNERAPRGSSKSTTSIVVAAIHSFDQPVDPRFVKWFERDVRPALDRAGASVLAYFVTDPTPNNFPALPVREKDNVFVWLASFPNESAYAALAAKPDWRIVPDPSAGLLKGQPELLRLSPTARSLLGY